MKVFSTRRVGRAWAACLETRDANSDECYRAQELSGLGPDEFFDKLMHKLHLLAEQPKPEKKPDAWALMKECAGTRDLESDACRTADNKRSASVMTDAMQACVNLRGEMSGGRSVEQLTALAEKINYVLPEGDRRIAAHAGPVLVQVLRVPLIPLPLPAW